MQWFRDEMWTDQQVTCVTLWKRCMEHLENDTWPP